MPKENACKKAAPDCENSAVNDNGPSPTPKKPCNVIDEIFSTKKRNKSAQEKVGKQIEDESPKAKKLKEKKNKKIEQNEKSAPDCENSAVKDKGPSPPSKKPCNEIDEIFSTKKRKKAEQEKAEKLAEAESAKAKKLNKKKKKRTEPKEKEYRDPPSRPRNKTGDGLVVYTEEELGLAKSDAGGTPLCPFDCDCCF